VADNEDDISWTNLVNPFAKQLAFAKAVISGTYKFLLYGGARGGGKSYILRWLAVLFLLRAAAQGIKGAVVGVFCETYTEVIGRQVHKAKAEFPEWLGWWSGTDFILYDEYGAGRIRFLNLDKPQKYRSAEFVVSIFDEITQHPFEAFIEISQSTRWPGVEHSPIIAATNPGGPGHSWVKRLWIDKNIPDFMRKTVDNPSGYTPEDFLYLPALPTDNPLLPRSYIKTLENQPEPLRSAVLKGDWNAFVGQFFSTFSRHDLQCDPFYIPENGKIWGSLDPGWGGICSFGLWYLENSRWGTEYIEINGVKQATGDRIWIPGKIYRLVTYYVEGRNSQAHAQAILELIENFEYTHGRHPEVIYAGRDAFARKERNLHSEDISSDHTMANDFEEVGLYLDSFHVGRGSRVPAFAAFRQFVDQRRLQIFSGYNDPLLEEMEGVQADERNVEDIQGGGNDPKVPDHALDEAKGLLYIAHIEEEEVMQQQAPTGLDYGVHDPSPWEDG